jgi:hypothetical protein
MHQPTSEEWERIETALGLRDLKPEHREVRRGGSTPRGVRSYPRSPRTFFVHVKVWSQGAKTKSLIVKIR